MLKRFILFFYFTSSLFYHTYSHVHSVWPHFTFPVRSLPSVCLTKHFMLPAFYSIKPNSFLIYLQSLLHMEVMVTKHKHSTVTVVAWVHTLTTHYCKPSDWVCEVMQYIHRGRAILRKMGELWGAFSWPASPGLVAGLSVPTQRKHVRHFTTSMSELRSPIPLL